MRAIFCQPFSSPFPLPFLLDTWWIIVIWHARISFFLSSSDLFIYTFSMGRRWKFHERKGRFSYYLKCVIHIEQYLTSTRRDKSERLTNQKHPICVWNVWHSTFPSSYAHTCSIGDRRKFNFERWFIKASQLKGIFWCLYWTFRNHLMDSFMHSF